jgi:diaminohydroxyphosphoribosylaminopyrimidine deaminase / 5-amino-6-(5-phosphoribosylamino)uracil reductase
MLLPPQSHARRHVMPRFPPLASRSSKTAVLVCVIPLNSGNVQAIRKMTNPEKRAIYNPNDPLFRPIREADPTRAFVVAQLGQSLDGRIATPTGESRWINKDAALDHVHRLRAAVDAVMVGVGTVVADDPLLNVRRVEGPNPARVVIDPKGRVPMQARCFDGTDGARRIVVRACDAPVPPGVEVIRLAAVDGRLDPIAVNAALFEHGLKRMLLEGGAWTVSDFINARAVDRLHVLVAPVIIGSGKTGLSLTPIGPLADALRPDTQVHVLADGDVLFDCNLRS